MTLVVAAGVYNLGFGLFHLMFWGLLRWKEQLPRLSADNRSVVQALNISLTFLLLLAGWLYVAYPADIGATPIGRALALGMLCFWAGRAVQQVTLFDLKRRIHQILLVVFILGIAIHAAALWA